MLENNKSFVSLITPFEDRTYLCYTRGQFDNWRVSFMTQEGKLIDSPKDTYFFDYYLSLEKKGVSAELIYKKLKSLSRHITKTSSTEFEYLREEILAVAKQLLVEDVLRFEKATTALLAAMLSEERKAFTKLGKKLKLLGLYQVLVTKMSPNEAANWSRGKKWRDILEEYNRLGA